MSHNRYYTKCIWIIGIPREEEKNNGREEIFEKYFAPIAKIFPKLMEDIKSKC